MRRIYVIELNPQVWDKPGFSRENPHITGRPRLCLYVGETGRSPEERFRQHMSGVKANRFVRQYGVRLLERFMQQKYWPPVKTTPEARDAEKRRAESLRRRGYAVYSA